MASGKRDVTRHLTLASRALRQASGRELAALGLHPGQDAALKAIGDRDGLSLRDLADVLAVRPPTVTKTIARLSAQGFVEKRMSSEGTRQNHAFLTEAGLEVLGNLKAVRKRVRKTALKGLSDKDKKALVDYLQRIESNLDDEAQRHSAADD